MASARAPTTSGSSGGRSSSRTSAAARTAGVSGSSSHGSGSPRSRSVQVMPPAWHRARGCGRCDGHGSDQVHRPADRPVPGVTKGPICRMFAGHRLAGPPSEVPHGNWHDPGSPRPAGAHRRPAWSWLPSHRPDPSGWGAGAGRHHLGRGPPSRASATTRRPATTAPGPAATRPSSGSRPPRSPPSPCCSHRTSSCGAAPGRARGSRCRPGSRSRRRSPCWASAAATSRRSASTTPSCWDAAAVDAHYATRRAHSFLIAVTCATPARDLLLRLDGDRAEAGAGSRPDADRAARSAPLPRRDRDAGGRGGPR